LNFDDHCDESINELGDPWKAVHRWLDELFAMKGARHRRYRHNLEGIEECRRRWGDEAAEAARLHIIADLKMEGWDPATHKIPKDSQDYVSMGLF
jgi:hypothetical protein